MAIKSFGPLLAALIKFLLILALFSASPLEAWAGLILPHGRTVPLLEEIFLCAKELADNNLAFVHVRKPSFWYPQDVVAFLDPEDSLAWYFLSTDGIYHHSFESPESKVYQIQLPRHFSFYVSIIETPFPEALWGLEKDPEETGVPEAPLIYLIRPESKESGPCPSPHCQSIALKDEWNKSECSTQASITALAFSVEVGILAYQMSSEKSKITSARIERYCKGFDKVTE